MMKKKKIAYILFGVAGIDLVMTPIVLVLMNLYFQTLDLPQNYKNIVLSTFTIITPVVAAIFIIAGIIIYFKFRKE
ncbi:MAG: hypothetical protein ACFE96_18065 [Candidatus Hermodarchaeota archaeon]